MLVGVQEAVCEENSISKRQPQSVWSSREAFREYSHGRICCLIRVENARCEENGVSISILKTLVRTAV